MIKSIVTGCDYHGRPLLPYEGPNAGYYDKILANITDRLDYSLEQSSQCLLVRLVVRFPVDLHAHADNSCFQYFIEEYRRSLGRKLIHYTWVREQHHSHNHHYHLLLFFDGNKMRYFNINKSRSIILWGNSLRKLYNIDIIGTGLIHNCTAGVNGIPMNHGMMVNRNNPAMKHEAFKLCSYLAKINTKGSAPKNVREYGSSLLRREAVK